MTNRNRYIKKSNNSFWSLLSVIYNNNLCYYGSAVLAAILAVQAIGWINPWFIQPIPENQCVQNCAPRKPFLKKALYVLDHPEILAPLKLEQSNVLDVAALANQPLVKKWIHRFSIPGVQRNRLLAALKKCESYKEMIQNHFKKNGQPKEYYYVILIESACNPKAKSHKDAVGWAQFTKETGLRYGLVDRTNPKKSLVAMSIYFDDLYRPFKNHECSIMSANTGENRVARGLLEMHEIGEPVKDCWSLLNYEYAFYELNEASRNEALNHLPQIIAAAYIDMYGSRSL